VRAAGVRQHAEQMRNQRVFLHSTQFSHVVTWKSSVRVEQKLQCQSYMNPLYCTTAGASAAAARRDFDDERRLGLGSERSSV
jgi:hypothetical protein